MSLFNAYQEQLLTVFTQEQCQSYGTCKPEIVDWVFLGNFSSEKKFLSMFEKFFILSNSQSLDFNASCLIFRYSDNVRMTIINNSEKQNTIKIGPGSIIGVSLTKDGQNKLDIYFEKQLSEGSKIIMNLSKKLIRGDFHQCFKPLQRVERTQTYDLLKALRKSDGKIVAVKCFSKINLRKLQKGIESVGKQIQILRKINCRSIQKFLGAYQSQNSIYQVFQYFQGSNLMQLVQGKPNSLDGKIIPFVIFNLLNALRHLHARKIMHRDVQPKNIVIKRNNYGQSILTDFGIGEFYENQNYLHYKCGTPGYLAPEVANMGAPTPYGPACDIFSAGVTFYILLTGSCLFQGATIQQLMKNNKNLQYELNENRITMLSQSQKAFDLLTKMLEKDPNQRISAEEALKHEYFLEKVCPFLQKIPLSISSQLSTQNILKSQIL